MMTPLGPPGEDDLILLGPLPLIHCRTPVAIGRQLSPLLAEVAMRNEERQAKCRKQRSL